MQEAGGASRGFAAPSSLGGVPRAALEAQEGLSRGSPVAIHRADFHTKKICFSGLQLIVFGQGEMSMQNARCSKTSIRYLNLVCSWNRLSIFSPVFF